MHEIFHGDSREMAKRLEVVVRRRFNLARDARAFLSGAVSAFFATWAASDPVCSAQTGAVRLPDPLSAHVDGEYE